eukprot:12425005-Karenia_brevis.AAC.1
MDMAVAMDMAGSGAVRSCELDRIQGIDQHDQLQCSNHSGRAASPASAGPQHGQFGSSHGAAADMDMAVAMDMAGSGAVRSCELDRIQRIDQHDQLQCSNHSGRAASPTNAGAQHGQ